MNVEVDALLQSFERFGIHLGLEASQQLLADLGNPQQQVPVIHVAGSNGKGSVCAYLSAILTAAGYRTGRFISPHLVSWTERFCINDEPIAPDTLLNLLHQVKATISADRPSLTQFEVITAAAWLYFTQQQVDIAVMEVGLGGRLDATNVIDRPLVSVITSISREHWQRLGPTLADIAFEKAGILKPGCPAVVGPLPPEAEAVVKRRIADLGCPAVWPQPAESLGNGWAVYPPIQYPLPLQGAVQLTNSALAIATVQILRQQGWEIPETAIVNGMANTRWPGRLQWITWRNQPLLIDGAHNPASAAVLRQFVETLAPAEVQTPFPIHWVMGMLSTKDHADIFSELLRPGDRLFLVPVPGHSSADPQELAQLARKVCPQLADCQVFPALIPCLEAALATPAPLRVLCGSLYLLGDFLSQQQAEIGELSAPQPPNKY